MSNLQSQSSESEHNEAERKKSNLAFAFFCMEKDRAKDMEVFYAFCRLMDDIADEETQPLEDRRKELQAWKTEIEKIYAGSKNLTPLAKEMADVIARRNIPQQYIQDIIDGCLTDTYAPTFETFEQIRKYCYGVASAVGLVSIYIFGFKNERTKLFAEALGYALQFTNILRDIVDDIVSHNRVYIPAEELNAFGVQREDLRNPSKNPNCKKLFKFLYFRAKHFFNKARRLIAEEDRKSLTPAFIMWAIYEKILDSLKEKNFNITATPLKISKSKKIRLALKAIRNAKRKHPQNTFYGKASVVGAGIAGITLATRLALEGFDVEVFEARSDIGGRICKIKAYNTQLDNAVHAAMGCYENFFNSIKLLGNNPNDYFEKVSGMDFIYTDKSVVPIKYPSKSNFIANVFSALSYTKLKNFASPKNLALLLSIKLGLTPHKNETALEFLNRKNIPQDVINTFWEPFCISALNTSIDNADAVLMTSTIKKSILKGFENAILYLPKRPMQDAFEIFKTYLKGVGAKISFSNSVKSINIKDNKVISIETNKSGTVEVENLFFAINANTLKTILPQNCSYVKKLTNIKQANITNIYFTSAQEIIANNYACLIGSPLHWIFNHTEKLPKPTNEYLYSVTISDTYLAKNKTDTKQFLKEELSKHFDNVEISDVLPTNFMWATISADVNTEKSRPKIKEITQEFSNVYAVGDWLQTELPCTMESAAKSAFEIEL